MKYKAIVSDIDGTLTPIDPTAIPTKKVLEAIRKAENKGLIFTMATGRPIFLLDYLLEHMNMKVLVIFDNGAGIYDNKEKSVIWESILKNDYVNNIISISKKYPHKLTSLSSQHKNIQNPKHIDNNTKVRKFAILGLNSKNTTNLIKELEQKYKDLIFVRAPSFRGEGLEDVYATNPDATKQHAILKLSEILGIQTHEIIGIGDHYNDFPLLMACGLKVAMGNAVPELKEIADYIAPDVEHDGVADVIEKFILNPS